MTYRTILVHLVNDSGAERVLQAAALVARRYDAFVTGVHVIPGAGYYPGVYFPGDPKIFADLAQQFEQAARKCGSLFTEAMDKAGVAHEWRSVESDLRPIADHVVGAAHVSDLVICGQPDPDRDGLGGEHIGEIVLDSGRPVLVIPYVGRDEAIGKRVLIAWNGSRESARAVVDALPFLQAADDVMVLAVASGGNEPEPDDGAGLLRMLERHGVTATFKRDAAPDIGVGDELLSRMSDHGTDLLVMGAYGHSRIREFILGGVTRSILGHMTAPVLMAH